jgi:hypothetical protein
LFDLMNFGPFKRIRIKAPKINNKKLNTYCNNKRN